MDVGKEREKFLQKKTEAAFTRISRIFTKGKTLEKIKKPGHYTGLLTQPTEN
jgi:hypothetical protein